VKVYTDFHVDGEGTLLNGRLSEHTKKIELSYLPNVGQSTVLWNSLELNPEEYLNTDLIHTWD